MKKWDNRFIELAQTVSTWSRDPSTKCGAVIVRPDKTIASVGFNGFPRKIRDTKERYENREEKYARVIHAEVNAILNAKEVLDGYTLYVVPGAPCHLCAGIIIQSGISMVIASRDKIDFEERWASSVKRTIEYFNEAGVTFLYLP